MSDPAVAVSPDGPDSAVQDVALGVDSLRIQFGGLRVIDTLSFQLREGRRLALIGPNGAGKTSAINAISGSIRPAAGKVEFYGRDIGTWPAFRRARAGLRRTFQNLEVFNSLTIRETLLVALEAQSPGLSQRARRRRLAQAEACIDEMNLGRYGNRVVRELPYGGRKLVEVARALVCDPKVMLLDEPAAGLDSNEKSEFMLLLNSLLAGRSIAVVLVEHDMPTVEGLCRDHVLVLSAGSLIAEGKFSDVVENPAVIEAYLGSSHVAVDPDHH